MAGLSIAAASSQAWAEMGAQAERALNTGWILDQTVTSTGGFNTAAAPSTATAFLSSGDGTSGSGNGFYALNRMVRVIGAGSTAYAAVQSAVYGAPVTTVTLYDFQPAGGATLSTVSITNVAVSPLFMNPTGNDFAKLRILNRTTTTVVASTASVTADSTLYTFTVPGGVLGTSGILRFQAFGDWASTAGLTPAFKVLYGATTVLAGTTNINGISGSTNTRYWNASVNLQNVSATNVQRVSGRVELSGAVGPGTPATAFTLFPGSDPPWFAAGYGTAAENSSTPLAFAFILRTASTSTAVTINFRHGFLEMIQ